MAEYGMRQGISGFSGVSRRFFISNQKVPFPPNKKSAEIFEKGQHFRVSIRFPYEAGQRQKSRLRSPACRWRKEESGWITGWTE
ncbi:MAG: hypothetical protein ACLTQL_06060 [Eisenbergiella sp.]|nr:hypothetical protein [Bacillota bacterium]